VGPHLKDELPRLFPINSNAFAHERSLLDKIARTVVLSTRTHDRAG
jgi:hypothetical protein